MSQGLDSFGCVSGTIKVAAGHYVDLMDPDPKTIEIESIASALSKVCRFGGHCPHFYSVAEHCIHATALAAKEGFGGDALRAVLLHDAAEAYIGDVVKPLKITLPNYADAEKRFESAIEASFDVDFGLWHTSIKRFDRAMLKAEKMKMWPEDSVHWAGFGEIETPDVRFSFWSPDEANRKFIEMAEALGVI